MRASNLSGAGKQQNYQKDTRSLRGKTGRKLRGSREEEVSATPDLKKDSKNLRTSHDDLSLTWVEQRIGKKRGKDCRRQEILI